MSVKVPANMSEIQRFIFFPLAAGAESHSPAWAAKQPFYSLTFSIDDEIAHADGGRRHCSIEGDRETRSGRPGCDRRASYQGCQPAVTRGGTRCRGVIRPQKNP